MILSFILILTRLTFPTEAKLYAKTSNLSVSKWNTFITKQYNRNFKTLIECGSVCEITENCNAFKFEKSNQLCSLATLTQLEDGQPNVKSETFLAQIQLSSRR